VVDVDGNAGHYNECWVRCGGGKNAWKKVKVFVFVFEDMVVKLYSDDGGRMCLVGAMCAMGGECGKEVLVQSVRGVGGRAGGCSNVWENVMELFQDEGVWIYCGLLPIRWGEGEYCRDVLWPSGLGSLCLHWL
jgi:hypothetical protein